MHVQPSRYLSEHSLKWKNHTILWGYHVFNNQTKKAYYFQQYNMILSLNEMNILNVKIFSFTTTKVQ